jgi:hypothetical protein
VDKGFTERYVWGGVGYAWKGYVLYDPTREQYQYFHPETIIRGMHGLNQSELKQYLTRGNWKLDIPLELRLPEGF